MSEEQIRKQLLELDCPISAGLLSLWKCIPAALRCAMMVRRTIHEMLSKRVRIYGTASKKSRE